MNDAIISQPTINMRQAKSFKAAIVITRNDGIEPALKDLETMLSLNGLAYAMPAQVDGTTVISFNIQSAPPREGLSHGSADVLESAPELAKKKNPAKEDRVQ